MPKFVVGGPFPMRVESDGKATHAVTGQEVFYCLKCPFGSPDGMFLSMEQLRQHDMARHPVLIRSIPPFPDLPPKRRGRPPKVKHGDAR